MIYPPLTAKVFDLKRQDGWFAGKVVYSSGLRGEFFVSPSGREARLYGGRFGDAARRALFIALGLSNEPPPLAMKPSPRRPAPRTRYLGPSMQDVAAMVAEANGLTVEELKSPPRSRRIAKPRQAAMWLMLWTGKSTTQVGNFFDRDHTTVMWARDRHQARMCGEGAE